MMGTAEAGGPNRALDAAHGAITNPLLDIISMKGAKGVLINITGGFDMTLYEVDAAANEIRAEVDPQANIILGSTFDETMEGSMRVSVVATGIDDDAVVKQNTVVPNARRAADGYTGPVAPRRSLTDQSRLGPIGAEPVASAMEAEEDYPGLGYDAPRPSFGPDDVEAEAEHRKAGFSLFGWMKGPEGAARPAEPRDQRQPAAAEPDPNLDEELEIPAFLRRQMTQR
jgi:cell division protein FtsZ